MDAWSNGYGSVDVLKSVAFVCLIAGVQGLANSLDYIESFYRFEC